MSDNPLIDRIIHYLRQAGPATGTVIADAMQPYATTHFTRVLLLECVLSGRLELTSDLRLALPAGQS